MKFRLCDVVGLVLTIPFVNCDSIHEEIELRTIGFGSCNKQWLDQSTWDAVDAMKPDIWVFAGDAYYTNRKDSGGMDPLSLEAIVDAQRKAKASVPFQRMISNLKAPIIGTYDDHDRGVNDGGGLPGGIRSAGVVDREERKHLFLDFLDVPKENKLERERDGVYASHVYGKGKHKVKIIVLDTRYNRAPYIIPSVATIKYLPPVAALTRLFSALTGLVSLQKGDMLGEKQFRWLENELRDSTRQHIKVNVIVSSVQVFTSNPLVESWGHFPSERQRLLQTLQRTNPQGLVILSGDVHIGEMISLDPKTFAPIEFTSSGITHDCSDGGIPKSICNATFGGSLFNQHQVDFFPFINFGTIEIDWNEDGRCPFNKMTISIRNGKGEPVLQSERTSCDSKGLVLPNEAEDFVILWAFQSLFVRAVVNFSLVLSLGAFVALVCLIKRSRTTNKMKRE